MNEINWQTITPSELIRIAVEDVKSVEARDDAEIDMGTYGRFYPKSNNVCDVCFAGAVLLQRFGKEEMLKHVDPCGELQYMAIMGMFVRDQTSRKILSLDEFRLGFWADGLLDFYGGYVRDPDDLKDIKPDYHEDGSETFCDDMLRAADILEKAGL